MGLHIIAEFLGVDPKIISKKDDVKRITDYAVKKSGLKAFSSSFHQFEPFGVSCVYLLRESHLSVHTWPEVSYLALDIFSCDSDEKALQAFELLKEAFRPKETQVKILERRLYERLKEKSNTR